MIDKKAFKLFWSFQSIWVSCWFLTLIRACSDRVCSSTLHCSFKSLNKRALWAVWKRLQFPSYARWHEESCADKPKEWGVRRGGEKRGEEAPLKQSFNTAPLESLCSQTACSSAWKRKVGSRGFTYFLKSPNTHLLLHRNLISPQCDCTVINRYQLLQHLSLLSGNLF